MGESDVAVDSSARLLSGPAARAERAIDWATADARCTCQRWSRMPPWLLAIASSPAGDPAIA
jgi:hypothetical protein